MARRIRSQKEALEKMAEEERKQKEEVEKAKEELSVLDEELRKMQEEFEESSKACKEAEQNLEKFYEEKNKILAHLKAEEEKKQAEIKSLSESKANAQKEVTRLVSKKMELQKKIRIAKGVITPTVHRIIRSVSENGKEIEITSIKYNTPLIISENSVLTKLAIGDYVSYVGDGDKGTTTWRVWQKTDSSVLITPVLNDSCRKLRLSGLEDYLDIVKNASSQTDKINKACKEWYVNANLGITAENIRSMTIEDINEVCGYTPPEISKRYAYYPPDEYEIYNISYNDGSAYIGQRHCKCRELRFYTYDGGGIEKVDSIGYTYRKPEKYNPIYASQTCYTYNTDFYAHKDNPSIYVGDLLGDSKGLLASTCVVLDDKYMCCDIFYANFVDASAFWIACSDGDTNEWICGVRPLISLNSTLQVVGGDGTQNAPWEISK